MLDVGAIRKDFPILKEGRIYLDSSATSLTPEPILEKMLEYYREYRANVGRGIYKASQLATDAFESARGEISRFINAKPDEMIMVRNTSEGANLVARGIGLKMGDRVVTTILEHHSNYIVWLRECARVGAELSTVRADTEGNIDMKQLEGFLRKKTRVLAVTQTSNVLGVRPPVKEMAALARGAGAFTFVDGAQSVPHMRVDVKDLGCDFLAFSGHKMCGPTGAGGLYIRQELQDEVEPLSIGGGTIEDVGTDYYSLKTGPQKYEAGTPAIAEVIGLGEAARYLSGIGMANIESHERELTRRISKGMAGIEKLKLYGPRDPAKRAGIFSFNIGRLNPHDVAMMLDASAGIMVRSGHHCALPLTKELLNSPSGSVRASVYIYNTKEEADALVEALGEIARSLA
jgi:cysteine desulfurase/selenocysteine lyase